MSRLTNSAALAVSDELRLLGRPVLAAEEREVAALGSTARSRAGCHSLAIARWRSRFSATTGSSSVRTAACGDVWGIGTSGGLDLRLRNLRCRNQRPAVHGWFPDPARLTRRRGVRPAVADRGGARGAACPASAQPAVRCDHGRMTMRRPSRRTTRERAPRTSAGDGAAPARGTRRARPQLRLPRSAGPSSAPSSPAPASSPPAAASSVRSPSSLFLLLVGGGVWLATGGRRTAVRAAVDTSAAALGRRRDRRWSRCCGSWSSSPATGCCCRRGSAAASTCSARVVVLLLVAAVAAPAVLVGRLAATQRDLIAGVFDDNGKSATVDDQRQPVRRARSGSTSCCSAATAGPAARACAPTRSSSRASTPPPATRRCSACRATWRTCRSRRTARWPRPIPNGFEAGSESESLLNAVYRNGPAQHPDILGPDRQPGRRLAQARRRRGAGPDDRLLRAGQPRRVQPAGRRPRRHHRQRQLLRADRRRARPSAAARRLHRARAEPAHGRRRRRWRSPAAGSGSPTTTGWPGSAAPSRRSSTPPTRSPCCRSTSSWRRPRRTSSAPTSRGRSLDDFVDLGVPGQGRRASAASSSTRA